MLAVDLTFFKIKIYTEVFYEYVAWGIKKWLIIPNLQYRSDTYLQHVWQMINKTNM